MRSLSPAFTDALANPTLTLAWCWLIVRLDSIAVGFTSLDVPIVIDNITYFPFTGFDPSAAQISEGTGKLDSQTLMGIFDEISITKAELDAGLYHQASVRRFLINYLNPPTSLSLDPPNHLELPQAYIAEIERDNLSYTLKAKDYLSLLDKQIGRKTSMTCLAKLGDNLCRKNLKLFTHNVIVSEITSNRLFNINTVFPDGYFDKGRITFTSGNNANLHFDVAFHAQHKLLLYELLPAPLAVGDQLIAVAGCLKTELACITKFQNFRNFAGEPRIPTTDLAINPPSK